MVPLFAQVVKPAVLSDRVGACGCRTMFTQPPPAVQSPDRFVLSSAQHAPAIFVPSVIFIAAVILLCVLLRACAALRSCRWCAAAPPCLHPNNAVLPMADFPARAALRGGGSVHTDSNTMTALP